VGILNSIKKIFTGKKEHVEQESFDNNAASTMSTDIDFYIAGLEAERVEKNHFFKHNAYSPIEDRPSFAGLKYYPPNIDYRYELALRKVDEPEMLTLQTSTGDEQTYHRLGTVTFEVEGQSAQLAVYQSTDHEGLFVPFRDATSGNETYGAGRYLEPQELGGGKLLVDFNLSYNPYCAYSEHFSCPLPPFENHLTSVAIRAGEKVYKKPDIAN
jgi:uncharacterized protein (DUF1684 family)